MRELPDGSLEVTLVYATDLFDASTAQRMSKHFMVCSFSTCLKKPALLMRDECQHKSWASSRLQGCFSGLR